MRILIPGPAIEDAFIENVCVTLTEMGHEVLGSPAAQQSRYYSVPQIAWRTLSEQVRGDRPSGEDERLLARVRAERPDLLLCVTRDVHPSILEQIGRVCPRVLWFGDAPAKNLRWGLVNPHWDKIWIKDADAVRKLKLIGQNTEYLHEAMNPRWHRPIAERRDESVVVAGNYYGFRQAIVARLMRDGAQMALYGSQPPPWALPEIKRGWRKKYVAREEKSRVFGEAMACLNTFALSEGNSLNCRAFEIAGAGGLQLIEHRPAIEECFDPGTELLVFHTYEELWDHLERAKRAPGEMKRIRERGAARALAEHTYKHRLTRIMADVQGRG